MDRLLKYTNELNNIEHQKKKRRFPHLIVEQKKNDVQKIPYNIKVYQIKKRKKEYFDMIRNRNKNKKQNMVLDNIDDYF